MPGRNDPCHCGSGIKYKRCHLTRDEAVGAAEARGRHRQIPSEVLRQIAAAENRSRIHLEQFGHTREVVHGDLHGHKFVAVGGTLYYSDKWKTFTDFLLQYVRSLLGGAFGPDWYQGERAKPPEMRHPIARWYEAFGDLAARASRTAEGLFEATPDGHSVAYLNLAYDLFVVGDNARLQAEVVRRLRDPGHFHGARYELTVAAIMIRAGFSLEFECEADSSRRHPEFIATERATGARVAVEAKARRRPGVMGWVGPRTNPVEIRLSIDELLRDACKKATNLPLVVFIDANMPPAMANQELARWVKELHGTLPRVAHGFDEVGVFEGVPFALLALTNIPHDYAERGEFSAPIGLYTSQPTVARVPLPNSQIRPAIEKALRQYGTIPADFPFNPHSEPKFGAAENDI